MSKFFRSYFSRNIILLFAGFTFIFSLLIVIVPTVYRIQTDEKEITAQRKTIDSKVQSTYLPQAIYKAKYLEQLLDAHEKDVLILSDAAGKLLSSTDTTLAESQGVIDGNGAPTNSKEAIGQLLAIASKNNCTFYSNDPALLDQESVNRQLSISPVTTVMQSIAGLDPIIQDVFVRTIDQTEWVCTKIPDPAAHFAAYEYADQIYFPMTVVEWSIRWDTHFVNGIPIITVIAPIWSNAKFYGEVGINLELAILSNQIPQYNLSAASQMMILNNEGDLLAIPTWVSANQLTPWIKQDPSGYLNKPLTELMAEPLGQTLLTSHLPEKIKATTPLIFPIELNDEIHYLALAPVGSKSIKLLVVMPLEDIYNTLSFWGESFSTDIVPVLIELGISILGFSIVLSLGAAFSIKYFSRPIEEVSNTALSIAQGDLSKRLSEEWGGELYELARSFNTMVNNLQTSEAELLVKKNELSAILEIQKQEFKIISQIVDLTNQVSKLSKKLNDVIEFITPLVGTHHIGILLINNAKVYQSIIRENGPKTPACGEELMEAHYREELIKHPFLDNNVANSVPIYFKNSTRLNGMNGFALPIKERGHLVGLLFCCYEDEPDLTNVRKPFLSVLSNYLAVIIENAELQEKKRDLIVSEERQHMANELHDAISQSLFSLTLTEESIVHQIKNNGDAITPLNFLIDQTQYIQEEMRWLINELRPIGSERDNLTKSIQRQIENVRRLCPTMQVKYEISEDVNTLPLEILNHVNRIVQEAFSNVIRHANAQNLEIKLTIIDSVLSLSIFDDGRGFDIDQLVDGRSESYGIISMYGRVDQIKGTINIQTTPGHGTKILIQTTVWGDQE